MSLDQTLTARLKCDWLACQKNLRMVVPVRDSEGQAIQQLLTRAREQGWQAGPGARDLCPGHNESVSPTSR